MEMSDQENGLGVLTTCNLLLNEQINFCLDIVQMQNAML